MDCQLRLIIPHALDLRKLWAQVHFASGIIGRPLLAWHDAGSGTQIILGEPQFLLQGFEIAPQPRCDL